MDAKVSDKIANYFSQYKARHYKKGHILIFADDDVKYIYHLASGKVKQYAISYRGDEIILNMFKPPAFFPMAHAMNKTPAKYIFEAETDIEVHQAPVGDTIEFLKANPDVLYDLLGRVYAGTEGLLSRMEYLMSGSAKSRLVYELISEVRRFSKKDEDGSYIVGLSEKDLGARVGLSRETVSREIQKLKKLKLVDTGTKHIRIPDISMLEKVLKEKNLG